MGLGSGGVRLSLRLVPCAHFFGGGCPYTRKTGHAEAGAVEPSASLLRLWSKHHRETPPFVAASHHFDPDPR